MMRSSRLIQRFMVTLLRCSLLYSCCQVSSGLRTSSSWKDRYMYVYYAFHLESEHFWRVPALEIGPRSDLGTRACTDLRARPDGAGDLPTGTVPANEDRTYRSFAWMESFLFIPRNCFRATMRSYCTIWAGWLIIKQNLSALRNERWISGIGPCKRNVYKMRQGEAEEGAMHTFVYKWRRIEEEQLCRESRHFSLPKSPLSLVGWLLTCLTALQRSPPWSLFEWKWPSISLSLLLSNRAVCFVQSSPRGRWCLSGNFGREKCRDP